MFRASPQSDALVILGRLLDSLPIGFHVSDCNDGFHILYANRVWEHWLEPNKLPVAGKTFAGLFPSAEEAGVLELMRKVCATALPQHLKGFEFRELGAVARGRRGETSRWDWEIYPLAGAPGVTYLLNVIMDVSASHRSNADREDERRHREEASGVLRIFGVVPERAGPRNDEWLSEREYEVAELLAMGLTNGAIACHLNITAATVSSHVAHILFKLRFRSRAQVAAWIVGRGVSSEAGRLVAERSESGGADGSKNHPNEG